MSNAELDQEILQVSSQLLEESRQVTGSALGLTRINLRLCQRGSGSRHALCAPFAFGHGAPRLRLLATLTDSSKPVRSNMSNAELDQEILQVSSQLLEVRTGS
jgi:hypothetical protein